MNTKHNHRKRWGRTLLLIAIVLFLLTVWAAKWLSKPEISAKRIQQAVWKTEKEMQELIDNGADYNQYSKQGLGVYVFQNDTLKYWNNNAVGPKLIRRKITTGNDTICNLLTGDYYVIMTEGLNVTGTCPYCGSDFVLDDRFENVSYPSGIIPFKQTREYAEQTMRRLVTERAGIPENAFDPKWLKKMQGIYIPSWMFDCSVTGIGIYRCIDTSREAMILKNKGCEKVETESTLTRIGELTVEDIPARASLRIREDTLTISRFPVLRCPRYPKFPRSSAPLVVRCSSISTASSSLLPNPSRNPPPWRQRE